MEPDVIFASTSSHFQEFQDQEMNEVDIEMSGEQVDNDQEMMNDDEENTMMMEIIRPEDEVNMEPVEVEFEDVENFENKEHVLTSLPLDTSTIITPIFSILPSSELEVSRIVEDPISRGEIDTTIQTVEEVMEGDNRIVLLDDTLATLSELDKETVVEQEAEKAEEIARDVDGFAQSMEEKLLEVNKGRDEDTVEDVANTAEGTIVKDSSLDSAEAGSIFNPEVPQEFGDPLPLDGETALHPATLPSRPSSPPLEFLPPISPFPNTSPLSSITISSLPTIFLSHGSKNFIFFPPADDTASTGDEVLFDDEEEATNIYFGKLNKLIQRLHKKFPEFKKERVAMVLTFGRLDIRLSEDDVSTYHLSLYDIDRLHSGCRLQEGLVCSLEKGMRFICRFNALVEHVSRLNYEYQGAPEPDAEDGTKEVAEEFEDNKNDQPEENNQAGQEDNEGQVEDDQLEEQVDEPEEHPKVDETGEEEIDHEPTEHYDDEGDEAGEKAGEERNREEEDEVGEDDVAEEVAGTGEGDVTKLSEGIHDEGGAGIDEVKESESEDVGEAAEEEHLDEGEFPLAEDSDVDYEANHSPFGESEDGEGVQLEEEVDEEANAGEGSLQNDEDWEGEADGAEEFEGESSTLVSSEHIEENRLEEEEEDGEHFELLDDPEAENELTSPVLEEGAEGVSSVGPHDVAFQAGESKEVVSDPVAENSETLEEYREWSVDVGPAIEGGEEFTEAEETEDLIGQPNDDNDKNSQVTTLEKQSPGLKTSDTLHDTSVLKNHVNDEAVTSPLQRKSSTPTKRSRDDYEADEGSDIDVLDSGLDPKRPKVDADVLPMPSVATDSQ